MFKSKRTSSTVHAPFLMSAIRAKIKADAMAVVEPTWPVDWKYPKTSPVDQKQSGGWETLVYITWNNTDWFSINLDDDEVAMLSICLGGDYHITPDETINLETIFNGEWPESWGERWDRLMELAEKKGIAFRQKLTTASSPLFVPKPKFSRTQNTSSLAPFRVTEIPKARFNFPPRSAFKPVTQSFMSDDAA